MVTHIQSDLDAIVNKIRHLLPEAKVYLFGSYATGTQKEDSDIDLCVVVPEFQVRQMETIYLIRQAIRGTTSLSVDILAFTDEQFDRRANWKSTIQHTVANKGVLLNG